MAPIKRHKALKHLSREHHHALLLCFKIRKGIKLGIDFRRMKAYCTYFYTNFLISHFEEEEKWVFPLLRHDAEGLVKKAKQQHRRLHRLFNEEEDPEKSVTLIEEELDAHVRFEERVLFHFIQEEATKQDLEQLELLSHEPVKDPDEFWQDHFWETGK